MNWSPASATSRACLPQWPGPPCHALLPFRLGRGQHGAFLRTDRSAAVDRSAGRLGGCRLLRPGPGARVGLLVLECRPGLLPRARPIRGLLYRYRPERLAGTRLRKHWRALGGVGDLEVLTDCCTAESGRLKLRAAEVALTVRPDYRKTPTRTSRRFPDPWQSKCCD